MRIVYNEESLKDLKEHKIKYLKIKLKLIKEGNINDSKPYCAKNKLKIKRTSKEFYIFILETRERNERIKKELYQKEINDKKEEIEIPYMMK